MKPTPLSTLASLIAVSSSASPLVTGFAIDSRLVKKGDLFFALTGNRSDGHAYLAEIAAKGASGAVVRQDYQGSDHGMPLLRVPDVLVALQQMGKEALARRKTKVVAITGSMGKTTTKEFTAALLSKKYRLSKSPLSYNSKTTLPLSILLADDADEIVVLEMGMSEKGEIAHLVSIAPPTIACLTTVTYQHSTAFPEGLIGIAKEKGSIFSHPKTRLGIVNHETPYLEEILSIGSCSKKTFSLTDPSADFAAVIVPGGIRIENHFIPFSLPMPAHYQNFLAALSIARSLDVSWEEIAEAAPSLKLPPMRFEVLEKSGILFVNDAYNANPEATMAALKSLPAPKTEGKRIAVLAEMNALGVFTEEGHKNVAKTALDCADLLLCLGKHCLTMKKVWEEAHKKVEHFENKEGLAQALKSLAKPGDVVLLKGARAWALEELLTHF